jgi:spermidine synthase
MSENFEELDFQQTEMGELSLRRKRVLSLGGVEVFEIKLGDKYLMSSLFTKAEIALVDLALSELGPASLDVVVGGLGLGYTARAALENSAVKSLAVIEAMPAVIDWHCRGLVPLGAQLTSDPRCRLVRGDFFALVNSGSLDPENPGKRFHAVLLDIDHSPRDRLHPRHESFYGVDGLRRVAVHLHPGGVFAMWSDDPPEEEFLQALDAAFGDCRAHIVTFHNPLLERDSASTVYVARSGSLERDTAKRTIPQRRGASTCKQPGLE